MSTMSQTALKPPTVAEDVLQDLDSYLELVGEEEEEEEDSRSLTSSAEYDFPYHTELGNACRECRTGGVDFSLVLTTTANNGHQGCMREVLEAQKQLDLTSILSESGASLAHIAARRGDLEVLRLLLNSEKRLSKVGDVRGATPLHVCAYHGYSDCLSCLLQKGAQADQQDFDGATAIHFASASGHLDCLKELLKTGNCDKQTRSGETPVYFSAQEGHLDCVQWLVEHANADPFIASNDGMTPLHAAAQTGRLNITHWLVRTAKCPITCRTSDGATPVHFAAAKGHTAILEWMLHHSLATCLEQDDFGATPVHDAAEQGQLECLIVFYNHSVDLNQKDYDGFTAKDLAWERGHLQCVAFLEDPDKVYNQMRKHKAADGEAAGLGLLHSQTEERTKTKKKRSFSFLSKKKQPTNVR